MSVQSTRTSADPGAEPVVPGFAVLGRIGRGAGSTVWSARDLDGGAVYALKVASSAASGEKVAAAAKAEVREIALLRRLDHPHLVRLHRVVDLADGRRALVLDLAEIGSLADLVADRGSLGDGEASRLLAPVAQALAHLHARGVVHGDVSDGNVLIAAGGRPLLGDLGGARLLPRVASSVPPMAAAAAGACETPGFGAPELATGGPPTPASDVWSLGAVLKACLGHEAGALSALIAACTAADPTARPAADLVERVLRLNADHHRLSPGPVPSIDRAVTRHVIAPGLDGPGPAPVPRPRRWSRTPVRFAVLGLLLLAVSASAWWLLDGRAISAGLPPRVTAGGEPSDPVAAVHRLATVRAAVLGSGSSTRLAELDLRGSPAWRADVRLLSELSRQGLRVEDLRFRVASARLVRWQDDAAVVRTEIEASAHRRRGGAGFEVVPASPGRVFDLVLQPNAEGHWRVRQTLVAPDVQGAASTRPD